MGGDQPGRRHRCAELTAAARGGSGAAGRRGCSPRQPDGPLEAEAGRLCDALAPSLLPDRPSGDAAARALHESVTAAGSWNPEQVDALISLLVQARDATAALIGGATGGWRVTGPPVQWEPRPNLRMPAQVLMERS
jgi:hypothetical protein